MHLWEGTMDNIVKINYLGYRGFESTQDKNFHNLTFILVENRRSIKEKNNSLFLSMKEVNRIFIPMIYKLTFFYQNQNSNAEILINNKLQTSEKGIGNLLKTKKKIIKMYMVAY